jgi:hypothetical protein
MRRGGHRRYRRNPGMFGGLIDIAKSAIPVFAALYGSKFVVSSVAARATFLGTAAGPVLSVGAMALANWGAGKVGFLAKHKNAILLGTGLGALESIIRSFAPASVKSMIGLSDYVQMGDYIAVGATPINDSMTLSDYIAVGDGVEEELGLEEELGVEEELGGTMGGLMGGGGNLLAPVPTQSFLAPVPARSFTKQIPAAGTSYDNPGQLYNGIFAGKFGG